MQMMPRNTTCFSDSKKPQGSSGGKNPQTPKEETIQPKEDEKNKNRKQTQETCAKKPSHIQTQIKIRKKQV